MHEVTDALGWKTINIKKCKNSFKGKQAKRKEKKKREREYADMKISKLVLIFEAFAPFLIRFVALSTESPQKF